MSPEQPIAGEERIPQARRAAARRALQAVIGGDRLRLEPLAGGASAALVFQVSTGGAEYLLRLEGPPAPLRDPARLYACQRIAAEAGVAPPLHYADAAAGISLSAFVRAAPSTLSAAARLHAIAHALRALHAAPPFPARIHYAQTVQSLIAGAAPLLPREQTRPHLQAFDTLAAAYHCPESDHVSSHNDLNPGNVLFAGARPWIVDWESAFVTDRYVDLAAVANFWAAGTDAEDLLLRAYLGAAPDARQRARFYLVQQLNRMFYAMVLLASAATPQTPLAAGELDTPRLQAARADFHTLATREGRRRFAAIFLNEVLWQVRSARFEEAVAALR